MIKTQNRDHLVIPSQDDRVLSMDNRLEAMGYDFDTIVERVPDIFKIAVKYILSPGKQPERVITRSVLAYWAVRELGISGTKVGKRLGLSRSAVSPAKAGFKEVNNWFSASFTTCQSIDYLYTIHETHNCTGVPCSTVPMFHCPHVPQDKRCWRNSVCSYGSDGCGGGLPLVEPTERSKAFSR